ncbi:uncharacterized protein [Argopecten irradians]|uniref:uncharacterized protein n=1 Tax=Argopecten irradians TaxID=31199 RepID=UPI00371203B1
MAKINLLSIFISVLTVWIIFTPSLCQEEAGGPADTGIVPAVESENNITNSNISETSNSNSSSTISESSTNVTVGEESSDINSTSPINSTDTFMSSDVTSESSNSNSSTYTNSTSVTITRSDSVTDTNTTISDNSNITLSDGNATFSEDNATMDDNNTLSNDNVTVSGNITILESNTTVLELNVSDSMITTTLENMTMTSTDTSDNTTTADNMTSSDRTLTADNVSISTNMTEGVGDDSFAVNVTTSNETEIVIGDSTNTTVSKVSKTIFSSNIESKTAHTSTITTQELPELSPEETTTEGQSPFDTMGEGPDPFDDPFGNPFGDGPEGGDPFGEDVFGPEPPAIDLCTEPPCEPPAEPVTTQRPVTAPPPPPPPPPPAAASHVFDTLFNDQEQFELKRLPQLSLPADKPSVPTQSGQAAYERNRKRKIERLQSLIKTFNAGIPAFGGVNFFNPTKEFSSITENNANQIGVPQIDNSNQILDFNRPPPREQMFINNVRSNTVNPNVNIDSFDVNTNIVKTNTRTTSQNLIEKPTSPSVRFDSPPLPNPDISPPVRETFGSAPLPDGVVPPPPPPPQLDKSITKDSTFTKFFGDIEKKEPKRDGQGSSNTVEKIRRPSVVNSINRDNSKTTNSGSGSFAWPYRVPSSSSATSTQTSSARRVVNSVVNDAVSSKWLDTTPFLSDSAGGRIVDTSFMSRSSSSSNSLDKQLDQAASRIGIPFVGLGDISETLIRKEPPKNIRTKVQLSPSLSSSARGSAASTVKTSAPGVPTFPDNFQAPPMNVNTNQFSARRPGVPAWDNADPALKEFGVPSRVSSSSRRRNIADIWNSVALNPEPVKTRPSGSTTQQKPPTRVPPFIFAPKPSSNIGNNFINIPTPSRQSTPNIEQPPPPSLPPKQEAPSFQVPQFERPAPPQNLPFSDFNAESGGIPPPPPPPGRIGFDASEIFAKITAGSLGRSGTGESVITTKRSPRFVEDKLSAMNNEPVWENTFFNQPSFNSNPATGFNTFLQPSNSRNTFHQSDISQPSFNSNPANGFNTFSQPSNSRNTFPRSDISQPSFNSNPATGFNTFLQPSNSRNTFPRSDINQPSFNSNPSIGLNAFTPPSNPMNMFPNSDNHIPSFQDPNIPWIPAKDTRSASKLNKFAMPIAPVAPVVEELPETTTVIDEKTTTTFPLTESTIGDISKTTDSIDLSTDQTTTAPVESSTASTVVDGNTLSTTQTVEGLETTTMNELETTTADARTTMSNLMMNADPTNAKPVHTNEAFPAASLAQLREFPNAAEICRNCNFINGYCRLELPGNCNRFIECSKHDTKVRAFEKECSHGLFWHQGNLTCERPLRVKCEYDPCLQRGVSNHTYIGKCRAYWSCKRSYSSARCCAKGYGYGLHQDGRYGCIAMPDCKDDGHCMSKEEKANLTLINANKPKECDLLANPSDLFSYKRGSLVLPCAPGTRFDQEECTCITSQAAPISRVCKKDMYLDFEGYMSDAFRDKSGHGNQVQDKNVWTDNQGIAKFNKDSSITLWKYSNQNIGASIAITFRFLSYRYTSRMQTLLSNCDPKSGIAAIDITLDTQKSVVDFKIETTQSPGNKISLPYNALQWNNVTLIYDGGSFVAAVDDAYKLLFIQGEIPSKHPPIVIGGCSAKSREGLFGLVDDVAIYNGCVPEDLKNMYLFARK